MSLTSGLAIYFILWWIVLFVVLPFGVKSQAEHGTVVPGTEPGAPENPRLLRKVLQTTVISLIVFAAFYWVKVYSGLTFEEIASYIPG